MRVRSGLVLLAAVALAAIAADSALRQARVPGVQAAGPAPSARADELGPYAAPAFEPPPVAQALSVDQAYGAIPHQRTPYLPEQASIGGGRVAYLEALFALTDMAMVERVQTQLWLRSDGRQGADRANHPEILDSLDALQPPAELGRAHALIREAVVEQARLLGHWRDSGRSDHFDTADPLVRSSHSKLIAAYNELMARYPDEGPQNKQAFFDHLCALDFI